VEQGMLCRDDSVRAMDACWQWSKVCDVEVTPSGIWTLTSSEVTPKKVSRGN
jgi:hypothetical protein